MPAAPGGVTADSAEPLLTLTDDASSPPTVTTASDVKPVPVMAMVVPPLIGPDAGRTSVIVGVAVVPPAGSTIKVPNSGAVWGGVRGALPIGGATVRFTIGMATGVPS